MSTREERAIEKIRTRLLAVTGVAALEVNPHDDHADTGSYPRLAIIVGEALPIADPQRLQTRISLPITIRGLTKSAAPTPGEGDVPLFRGSAAYAFWSQTSKQLFKAATTTAHVDRLDGECNHFMYRGHAIDPEHEGGKCEAFFIDCEVEYVLHLNDPDL